MLSGNGRRSYAYPVTRRVPLDPEGRPSSETHVTALQSLGGCKVDVRVKDSYGREDCSSLFLQSNLQVVVCVALQRVKRQAWLPEDGGELRHPGHSLKNYFPIFLSTRVGLVLVHKALTCVAETPPPAP